MKQPEENIIVTFISCISVSAINLVVYFDSKMQTKKTRMLRFQRAISNRLLSKNSSKKSHWLEYADDKFSKQQISDIQAVLNVLYLFIPVPLFWALFDQQVRERISVRRVRGFDRNTVPLML